MNSRNIAAFVSKWTVATWLLFILVVPNAHAVIAGGMVANHYTVPVQTNGYLNLSADLRVTREPGPSGNTFWATQFIFQDATGGYIGIQQNTGSQKLAIFSIWNASGWTSAFASKCSNFGGEGTGVSCKMNYPWIEGRKYRFSVHKISSDAFSETWSGDITDLTTGQTQTIGEIQQGVKQAGITSLSQFVENFTQGSEQYASCSQVPAAVAVTSAAKVGGTSLQVSSTEVYGNCASIAQTSCTTDNICASSINVPASPASYRLKNGINNLCADTLGGGANLGLWNCAVGNANQTLTTTGSGQLRLSLRNLCLQGGGSGVQVSALACSTSSAQVWVPYAHSGVLFNLGSETCMDAAGGAVLNAKIQSYACADNQYQRWTVVP